MHISQSLVTWKLLAEHPCPDVVDAVGQWFCFLRFFGLVLRRRRVYKSDAT